MPIFENSGGGLKACLSQNKDEHFFSSGSFSILLQASKGEDTFFGDLSSENNFFAHFGNL